MTTRRTFLRLWALLPTVMPHSILAAQRDRVPRVGELWGGTQDTAAPYREAFRGGLREFGYEDGKTVAMVSRYANASPSRYPKLVEELVAARVEALLVTPTVVPIALAQANAIPLVCPTMPDPVSSGFVASLARPGGNLTGLTSQGGDSDPKRLDILRELLPTLKRADLIFEATDPTWKSEADALGTLARSVGIEMRLYGVRNQHDIESALDLIRRDRPQAVIVWNSPLTLRNADLILGLAARRVPVISEGRDLAQAGALITYSADFFDLYRRSAEYVHKILQGAKAGELPIQQPTRFELIVNLRTAKSLGIAVPDSILLRADEVIK